MQTKDSSISGQLNLPRVLKLRKVQTKHVFALTWDTVLLFHFVNHCVLCSKVKKISYILESIVGMMLFTLISPLCFNRLKINLEH
jgi:hypothetical protein